MTKLVWDVSFKRSYKKRVGSDTRLKKKFWDALKLFSENPFHTKLKTHKLTGKLSGLWALSIDYDCRIVFKFLKDTSEVLLIDIGSHDEVY
ncbi:MAG: type II toxin-antitoxin system mRNA interferase toxin, RelE/StbE family [Bacteroidia bacterium]|nr:type II toxin-antitoxin system mRNA interferase toxin, RelE/StbE family [Bacteroidia bacterium]